LINCLACGPGSGVLICGFLIEVPFSIKIADGFLTGRPRRNGTLPPDASWRKHISASPQSDIFILITIVYRQSHGRSRSDWTSNKIFSYRPSKTYVKAPRAY
jgi:hypothetical protein